MTDISRINEIEFSIKILFCSCFMFKNKKYFNHLSLENLFLQSRIENPTIDVDF